MTFTRNLSDSEKERERGLRDRLVATAIIAVDTFVIDNADVLEFSMTKASKMRLVVQAAIGMLIDSGIITPDNVAMGDEWVRPILPEHLRPDIDAAVLQYRAMGSGGS